MFSGNLLYTLLATPILGALSLVFVSSRSDCIARIICLASSAIALFLSLLLVAQYKPDGAEFQFLANIPWIPSLGVSFRVGVDGMSVCLIALTTFLTFLVIIASPSVTEKIRGYLTCILLLEAGMIGTFIALDLLSFYLFWELMLVPMYFLIGVWGGTRRVYAAIKFVLYTALGSLLLLVAIVYLGILHHNQFGTYSFLLQNLQKVSLREVEEVFLFLAFALAFAIKIPVFPFHTWLPDAHVEAPTGGSVILAGVLLKMGLYGLIRFCLPLFPVASAASMPVFMILGVVGIIFGALVAWMQTDIKKLVAYSSVSHLGFCVLGFSAVNFIGMQGCILQMINHGISTGALFFLVGVLYDRKHTRAIADYGGLATKIPGFAFVFLIFTLSSIGLPLTNGFVGEFLTLLGGFSSNKTLGVIAISGVVLGAMYMLSLYRRVVFGDFDQEKNGDLTDLVCRERFILFALLILVFVMGIFPQRVLDYVAPSSMRALNHLGIYNFEDSKHAFVDSIDIKG